jgi:hypothetical protein
MKRTLRTATVLAALMVVVGGRTVAQQRNVLVEMFTNSHCGLCPSAHFALKQYANSSPHASRIRYVYYHMTFPYSDDPLSQVGTADAAGRNQYYGPFSATPVTFFDGANQGTSYASWGNALDIRVATASPLSITLAGSRNNAEAIVRATIQAVGALPTGALTIHFVIVENVPYVGRNGVSPQDLVMRKMITGGTGESFMIGSGETTVVEKTTPLTNVTSASDAGIVVFVQEDATRTVLQSDYISYDVLAGVEGGGTVPPSFALDQNYPNPFNPTTSIGYSVGVDSRGSLVATMVRLAVYDMLGREVAVLVNEKKAPGNYEVQFNASGLASGIYFCRLAADGFIQSMKMQLLK